MKLHGDIVLMIQPSEVRQKEALVHAELFFSESTAVHAIFKYGIRLSSRAWHIEAALKVWSLTTQPAERKKSRRQERACTISSADAIVLPAAAASFSTYSGKSGFSR